MYNLKAVVLALVVGFSGTVSMAAVAADKIAVVDIARAIFSSNMAQARLKEAETGADFVALRAKYESSTADLQALAKEAETKRMTWSQEQAQSHQKKMFWFALMIQLLLLCLPKILYKLFFELTFR